MFANRVILIEKMAQDTREAPRVSARELRSATFVLCLLREAISMSTSSINDREYSRLPQD